ncbi:MAG: SpoIID/LytB domain-containing protein [Nitrospirae bacterium]|nr:SpoIID/LytB domain-containing protein [Nitrospirota bacterium]
MKTMALSMVILILASFSTAYARDIRVLILDKRFSATPDAEESIRKIGNFKGELLVSGVRYLGNIEIWKGERGLYLINEVPLEDYVRSVVLSEVADGWEMEALKAQAVIVRTYAVKYIQRGADRLYHLTSSTLHQLYRGDNSDSRVTYAVMQTRGEILTYDGEPIEAFYHSTCGGRTELPEEVFGRSYPYLKSVSSDCSLSSYWIWQRRFGRKKLEKDLGLPGLRDVRISGYTKTGRVKELTFVTAGGTKTILSKDLRRILGWKTLPSTWFSIRKNGDTFVFDGKGYGHGVGLCQWGAQQMAKEGKTYKEILSFYYPGTVIKLDGTGGRRQGRVSPE